jgi:hypothetical protein
MIKKQQPHFALSGGRHKAGAVLVVRCRFARRQRLNITTGYKMNKELTLKYILLQTTKTANGCMEWNGSRNTTGYARFGKPEIKISRLVLELSGYNMAGLSACHKCDNPPCVNPDHLFPGTNQDNMRDMVAKGRHINGKRKGLGVAHGTASYYNNHHCRCGDCRKAWNIYVRERKNNWYRKKRAEAKALVRND